MRFEQDVSELKDTLIGLGYVVDFGGEERLGQVDEDGRFQPMSAAELPVHLVAGLAPGLALLLPCQAQVTDDADEVVATLEFAVEGGRAVCKAIFAAKGQELTGDFVRRIPFATLAREAVAANVVRILRTQEGMRFAARFPAGGAGFGTPADELDVQAAAAVRRPSRRQIDPAFLAAVATAYRESVARNVSPGREIQRRFGPTTLENARHWIMLARQRGHLGPSLGTGKPGEGLAH